MAATNFTPIILYHTTTASATPSAGNLNNGELAINITDGKLFYKDNGGTVQVIATKGTGTIGGSTTQVQYNNAGSLAGSANFTFNGTTATINTLNLTNALGTTFGGTGLNAYTTGDLVYASGTNTLAKLGIGLNTYILTSTGSVPQWSAPSAVTVATANNLAGGAAGSVPYQSGASTTTFLSIGTSGQILSSTGSAPQWSSPAALTKTDDTNVTLTLGGSASTALVNAASLTLGWTGQLSIARGGTNATATPTAGAVAYGTGTAYAFTAAGTSGQVLTSNGAGVPTWASLSSIGVTTFSAGTTGFTPSTATSGAITLAGTLATTNGGTGLTSFTANRVFYSSSTSAIGQSANLTFDGTTLVAANFTDSSLTAGRVTYAGTGGNLTDNANFVFDGSNLGVGTSSPVAKLDVRGSTYIQSNSVAALTLNPGTDTVNSLFGITFSTPTYAIARILAQRIGATDAAQLLFYTSPNGDVPNLRMTLDQSGNLVIGAASTVNTNGYKLLVVNDIAVYTGTDSSGSTALRLGSSTSMPQGIAVLNGTKTAVGGGDMLFLTASGGVLSEKMRLTGAGLVGIATTSPSATLQIGPDQGTTGYSFRVATPAVNAGSASYFNVSGTYASTISTINLDAQGVQSGGGYTGAFAFRTTFETSGPVERMRITGSGNLLIGTTSDQNRRVQINGQLALVDSALNSIADIDVQTNGEFRIRPYNASGSAIVFGTSPSGGGVNERARINSVGDFLIGTTTTSGGRATISANANYGDLTTGYSLVLWNTVAAGTPSNPINIGVVQFGNPTVTNSDFGKIAMIQENATSSTAASLRFYTNTGGGNIAVAERARFDTSGNYLVGTTSSGGTASNTTRVTGGIFSTFNSTPSIPHNTATTVATLPSGDAIYLASAALQSSSSPTGYNELAVIRVSQSTASVTVLVDASSLSISVSGLNVQITHGQGATQPCPFALIRLL